MNLIVDKKKKLLIYYKPNPATITVTASLDRLNLSVIFIIKLSHSEGLATVIGIKKEVVFDEKDKKDDWNMYH